MHHKLPLWVGVSGVGAAAGLWLAVRADWSRDAFAQPAPAPVSDPRPSDPPEIRGARSEPGEREPVAPTPSQATPARDELAGAVQEESGRPVPGAYVLARSAESPGPSSYSGAYTGTRGEFRLTGLGDGRLELEVTAHGFTTLRREVPPPRGGLERGEIVLVLHRGQSLGGRVQLADGSGGAGVRLSIEDERSLYWRGGFAAAWDARCDQDGRFLVSGLSTGPFRVRAWVPNSDPLAERAMTTVSGVAPGTLDLELRVRPPGSVELVVPGSTKPARGCSVLVLDCDGTATGGTPDAFFPEETRPAWTVREASGGFRVDGVEAGEHLLLVRCQDRSLAGWTRLDVPAGGTAQASIALGPAARLEPRLESRLGGTKQATFLVRGERGFALRVDGDLEPEGILLSPGSYRVRADSGDLTAEAGVTLLAGERRELRLVFE